MHDENVAAHTSCFPSARHDNQSAIHASHTAAQAVDPDMCRNWVLHQIRVLHAHRSRAKKMRGIDILPVGA